MPSTTEISSPAGQLDPVNPAQAGTGLALLGRGFAVMEAIASAKRPPSLSKISRQTGIPPSTVHRILAALHEHGMVDRCEDGYRPGLRAARLFDPRMALHWQELRDCALPAMIRLQTSSRCFVSLLAPSRQEAVFLLRLSATEDGVSASQISIASTQQTVAAKLLDAYQPGAADPAPHPGDERGSIEPRRMQVRATGHIYIRSMIRNQPIFALAVPVFDRSHQAVAALTVCGQRNDENIEDVLRQLWSASSETARRLRADLTIYGP